MLRSLYLVLLFFKLEFLAGKQLWYNETFCKEDISLKTKGVFYDASTMINISTEPTDASIPTTLYIQPCERGGFKSLALTAEVQGYFLSGDGEKRLSSIRITCNDFDSTNTDRQISKNSALMFKKTLKFRWEPPLNTRGKITFHIKVSLMSPKSWLRINKHPHYQQGDNNQVVVEQKCYASSATSSFLYCYYGKYLLIICLWFLF